MTWLELYDAALIEQNKLEAPTLLIEDFNYLINKAIIQYINLTYARFDINQQTSDDLRWLQRSVELDVFVQNNKIIHPMEEANYACYLPEDYLHMLNCTVYFSPITKDDTKCKPDGDDDLGGVFSLCRRMTANQFPALIKNAYLKPSYKNPYYYINTSGIGGSGTAGIEESSILDPCNVNNISSILYPCEPGVQETDTIMEIRCGKNKNFKPDVAYVDYLKYPETISLTWEDVNGRSENTVNCEFPNAVAYEIINIFLKLVLENASDPRMQTHFAINQTIGGIPQSDSKK